MVGSKISLFWDRMQVSQLDVTCCTNNTFMMKSDKSAIVREEGTEDRTIEPIESYLSIEIGKNQAVSLLFKTV